MRYLIVLLVLLALAGCQPTEIPLTDAEIEANNRGVALMGQYRNEDARVVFAELLEGRPDWTDVEVNLAIATLNRQRENDELVALEIVEGVLVDLPNHLRARYIAGLMRFYIGDTELSLAHFLQVSEAAQDDAHVSYFLAQALSQLGRVEEALDYYRRSIDKDPYLRSAYYGAALAYRQMGDADRAREMLQVYQRFENNPRAQLAEFVYTRKGVLAEALAVSADGEGNADSAAAGSVLGERRVLTDLGELSRASLTVADIDGDGLLDLFISGDQTRVLRQTEAGDFEVPDRHPLNGLTNVNAALWGDLANRGQADVLLCREGPNQVFRRDASSAWAELDSASDLFDGQSCIDGGLFDADHDGDLDALVINRNGANELYNNDFNDNWRRLSETPDAAVLAGGERGSRKVAVVDLEGDRDGDLIVLHDSPPHQILINDRLWRYEDGVGFDSFVRQDLVAATVADLGADGQVDLIGLQQDGGLWRWQPDDDGVWNGEPIGSVAMDRPDSAALSALDMTGDGQLELLVQHAGGFDVRAWRGLDGFETLYSESLDLLALTPILLDSAQGPSLAGVVSTDEGSSLALWPAGAGRGLFVAIAPTGLSDVGAGMRSNASGIGTHLVLRSGSQWAIADTYDRHGAPGQSLQPISIGVGSRDRADFVKLLWSDGVLQTEMDLAVGEVHRIAEFQRQLASCPVLYAWNGEQHEFVSDLLGVGGVGFFLSPGEYAPPRPWEFFRFPEGSLAPRNGRYEIKIGEPMEEIAYIDHVRLHVHDLPPGWRLTVDERLHGGGGPAPTGAPVFYREASRLWPVAAVNDRGEDVLDTVLTVDGVAAPPGVRDQRYLGRLVEDHELVLRFDQAINPAGSQPVLIADGWVDYPYSQTLFAAWQAGEQYTTPSLDAYADGQWQVVYEQWGYPAGMPREMSLPLNDLPPDTTALRLRGNWEVYWDALSVIHAEAPPNDASSRALDAKLGRLARTGFPRRDTLAQDRPYYDYQDRSPFWDTRYPTGFYTDFGPVNHLVETANGALVVFGPGEEMHLEFAAPEAPAEGWRREVVLEVRGFAKDMDLYTGSGGTVGPLPVDDTVVNLDEREEMHADSLNRFQWGF
ncbi:MAG: FG-GAP-like repeat-containing protein [Pseudomonadota bacterium]